MGRRIILGAGAFALTLLALVCIPRHLPSSNASLPLVPANFHARLEQHELTLRGSLPDRTTHDRILERAHSLYDRAQVRIVDQLTVDQRIAPATWLAAVPSILPVLGDMNGRGSMIIDGHYLVLSGRVQNEQVKGAILRSVTPVTATGLELEDHILAAAQPASRFSLQTQLNEILSRNQVEFDSNQSTLTSRGRTTLDRLIPLLRQAPRASIEIGGHTDGFGAPEYNRELSRRRAETVRQYFIKHGLTNGFTVVGYGASKPRSAEKTQNGLRRNRRIELRVQEQGDL
ncbi:MAG TPA: OmpA family protein [Nitrospira sp.]